MTCDDTRSRLLDLHFSSLDDEARDTVETHLVGCSACVQEFLALKRACDEGDAAPSPGPAVAARIHQAVARQLRPPRPRWERPLAIALAAVITVFAVSMVGELSRVGHWPTSAHAPE